MSDRKCIVTRQNLLPEEMIRFVIGPDGCAVPDLKHQLPGRGVWITAKARYIVQAVEKNLFARAFRAPVQQTEDLAVLVGDLLTKNCLNYLSLARKAGLVTLGFSKVKNALKGDIAALIEASDAADDGKRKLRGLVRPGVKIVGCLTSVELSLALGRPNVVHGALRPHGLTDKFLVAVARIKDYEN